jgi:F0F1-type ATP synthase membrane subunit c/vacuolar-type H+-ATPase subunit K
MGKIKYLLFVALIISITVGLTKVVFAQTPAPITNVNFNLARTMTIDDKDAIEGDIMSISEKGDTITRSKGTYDPKMFGVLTAKPLIVYRTNDQLPLVRIGEAIVNVNTIGGPIKIGDYITSSPMLGKGMKASEYNGYVVGLAMTAFDGKGLPTKTYNKQQYAEGTIKLTVQVGPASPILIQAGGGIFGTLKQWLAAIMFNINTSRTTERIIRYILAALVAILAIYISFRTFGKNISKGIEAIGRNPLAKNQIQAVIILNVILIVVVCIGGLALSLIIISI